MEDLFFLRRSLDEKIPFKYTQIIHPWVFHSTHCKMDEYSWDKPKKPKKNKVLKYNLNDSTF
jgi:hypothetical protein